jgi:hypothetical protein
MVEVTNLAEAPCEPAAQKRHTIPHGSANRALLLPTTFAILFWRSLRCMLKA